MSGSFPFTPAHVAGLPSHIGAAVRESVLKQICAGRGRVLQGITGFNRPRINPVRTISAATTPPGSGNWREPVECGGPSHALRAPAAFPIQRRDMCRSGVCNLVGCTKAIRSLLSFLRALVHDANQSASRFFHGLVIPPVHALSFVPIDHANKKAWRRQHETHGNSAFGAIGVKNNV